MLTALRRGAICGAVMAVLLALSYTFYLRYYYLNIANESTVVARNEVYELEPAREPYLGRYRLSQGGLGSNADTIPEGKGWIRGRITTTDRPISGLKFRVVLNGNAYSQWLISDQNGQYTIKVPYGEYEVSGFELDRETADAALSGLIDAQLWGVSGDSYTVAEFSSVDAVNFLFSKPIQKTTTKLEFNLSEPMILSWGAYPGSDYYEVQLWEAKSDYKYGYYRALFKVHLTPHTNTNSIDLKPFVEQLNPGHFYYFDVVAKDNNGRIISRTINKRETYDFAIK